MKKYTTVLFDIDNTLLDFDADERCALIRTLEEYAIDASEENLKTYSAINAALWTRFDKGEITKEDIKNTRFQKFFEAIGHVSDVPARTVNDRYGFLLSEGGILLDGAMQLCQRLTESGCTLYAVTNGIELTQIKRLKKSGLDKVLRDVFISERVGHQKPKKEFFRYVFEHIDEKDKSKMILIGDSLTSDIKGALDSGIDCIWLNRTKNENIVCQSPTYEVSSIEEIASLFFRDQA